MILDYFPTVITEPFKRNRRHIIAAFLATLCVLVLFGCGNESATPDLSYNSIPKDAFPCDDAYRKENEKYWPYHEASSKYPFLVHYSSTADRENAIEIMIYLEKAWQRQIDEQHYEPPPSDTGMCGPDGRFDVFLWRGINTCQVQIVSEEFVTKWGGRASYMQLDPWGKYGGEVLGQTIAHEFNHATHAANDWYELPIAFEMSASYVEQFYDGPADTQYIKDFQMYPDWGLLRDDNYKTWYMYGSSLYLNFVRNRYLKDEVEDNFLPQLWVKMRDTPNLYVNEPHFVDGINWLLNPKGFTFLDSVPDFARWRYYTGDRKDKDHFQILPPVAEKVISSTEAMLSIEKVLIPLTTLTHKISPEPMMIGSAYLEIKRENAAQTSFQLSLVVTSDPSVRWVVQAAPGLVEGSDGEIVDVTSGPARVSFTPDGSRTLILTVLPVSESDFDPNHQTAIRYPVSVKIEP
jgi:hypothetical protein